MSSGILHSPNYTMQLIYETLYKLRTEFHFQGYIHVKAIPGADQELIQRTGFFGRQDEREFGASDSRRT